MTSHPQAKTAFLLGSGLLALAVLIGAFGAHGLKNMVTPEKLVTFETGVRYHFYHGFGLLFLGLIQQQFQELKLSVSLWSFVVGILLFSFNCYFYVISGAKVFAMIVPLGGLLFVLGWIALFFQMRRPRI
jgi:uncharacterized membrane protein YgdD (TMEM256/DUF423 family)